MITLYDDGSSPNTEKVRIMLAELGLPFERRQLDLAAGASKTPDMTALNPNQKTAILVADDVTIWESGAILLYLADTHGRFIPP
jgi:GST-like protein